MLSVARYGAMPRRGGGVAGGQPSSRAESARFDEAGQMADSGCRVVRDSRGVPRRSSSGCSAGRGGWACLAEAARGAGA
jgi:hypothetical protein